MQDLHGHQYGRLMVLAHCEGRRWLCYCTCGQEVVAMSNNLRNGHTQSCGCLMRERTAEANRTHGEGTSRTPEYVAWYNMRQRCTNPKLESYKNYGGRGIKVCKRWERFENFLADMGRRPEGMTLDREKNNRGYSKSNCRWATPKQQANNRRNSCAKS